jgi:quinol monooxygenase YgiN
MARILGAESICTVFEDDVWECRLKASVFLELRQSCKPAFGAYIGWFAGQEKQHDTKIPKYMKNEVRVGIMATLKAKPGKEGEVEQFLKSALPLANQEPATTVWFALRLGPSTYAVFDAFADDSGRDAHLSGPIAAALLSKWKDLLAELPKIEKIDVLAAKLAG